jgi:hypothetical protein
MGRYPAPTPLTHCAIGSATGQSDLLVTLLRMLIGGQNDPRSHDERLGGAESTNELFKPFGFRIRQVNGITGIGSTHFFLPPIFSLSVLVHPVKLGNYL